MKKALLVAASIAALATASTAWSADVAAGQAKSKSCVNCHGANGEGKAKNPPIAGMDEKVFIHEMEEYKTEKRKNGMMKAATAKLTDEDIANLAAYYATLKKK